MSAYDYIITGSYTSDGTARTIELPSGVDRFELFNFTNAQEGSASPGEVKRAWWQRGMAQGSYYAVKNTDGAATDETTSGTSGGFTVVDNGLDDQLEAPVTITSISTAATPVVTTSASHGYATGDIVRISGGTGALQIDGNDYSITVTGATTFTINQPQLAVAQTGGSVRRLRYQDAYYPRVRLIMSITAANPGVITTSVNHGLTAGQLITIKVPTGYGMPEIDGLTAQIASVTATTITTDIDTSGFTAFAYPAAAAYPNDRALVVPFGDAGNTFDGATVNQFIRGIHLGTSVVGNSSDVNYWIAYKSAQVQS